MFGTLLLWALGYCLFAWVAVFSLFVFTNILRGAHPAIVVWAPALPFLLLLDKWEELKENHRERQIRNVSRKIAEELRKNGISVRGEFGKRKRSIDLGDDDEIESGGTWFDDCEVFADVSKEQEDTYRNVYAWAIRTFTELTPKQLCGRSYPREPLDREWALKNGFDEYFAVEHYVPCVDCGKVETWHSLEWGDDASHARGWMHDQSFSFKDNTRETRFVSGNICRECSDKLGWIASSGSALRKST